MIDLNRHNGSSIYVLSEPIIVHFLTHFCHFDYNYCVCEFVQFMEFVLKIFFNFLSVDLVISIAQTEPP